MAKVLERSLYQTDYYAWTKQQAAELRRLAAARVNSTLDLANLAEEVESLGRSDLATIRSQMRRIIEHLLKLEHSPAVEPRFGWRESVIEARDVIPDVITATLRRDVEAELAKAYQQGRRRAEAALMRARRARGRASRCRRPAPTASTRSSATTGTRPTATASSTTSRTPERDFRFGATPVETPTGLRQPQGAVMSGGGPAPLRRIPLRYLACFAAPGVAPASALVVNTKVAYLGETT